MGGLTSRETGRPQKRYTSSPYPGRQSPQVASEVAVPEVAAFRPRDLQEVCGRQSSESSASEKLPAGHNLHCTSFAGLWICPQAWQDKNSSKVGQIRLQKHYVEHFVTTV